MGDKKNELVEKGAKEVVKQGGKVFKNIDKQLPNTPIDKAGKSLGKKICKGIDKAIDTLF
ncbi:hypothetical protein JCM16358_20460 [Halanaerocella petrolearia]